MKNFMKVCGIMALILIMLGVSIGVAAWTIQGPERISDIVNSVTDGRVNVNIGDRGNWGVRVDDWLSDLEDIGTAVKDGMDITVDINENIEFDNDRSTLSGDVQKVFAGAEVKSLDIETGGCAMNLMVSADDDFHLEAENMDKLQCYTEKGELDIRVSHRKKTGNALCRVNLYVPKDFRFTEVEIDLGAGTLEFENLDAGKIKLEVGAGEIVGGVLRADKAGLEVGAGSVSITDMEVGELEAEVGQGALLMEGSVSREAELECAMGSIEMTLNGGEKDYDYILESAMGSVLIGTYSVSGLAHEKRIDNGAGREIKLECSMGSIEISFTD